MKRPFVAVALCYAGGVILGWFLAAPLAGCFCRCPVLRPGRPAVLPLRRLVSSGPRYFFLAG